jgi:hypothetical protein
LEGIRVSSPGNDIDTKTVTKLYVTRAVGTIVEELSTTAELMEHVENLLKATLGEIERLLSGLGLVEMSVLQGLLNHRALQRGQAARLAKAIDQLALRTA